MKPGAVILCGGESRRMGRPKPWLPFGTEPMLCRVIKVVSKAADPIVVVAAPGQEIPAVGDGVEIVRDPVRGRGPLQGLAAGLAALPRTVELAYATATDVPFLEPRWINLMSALIEQDDLAIPFHDGYHHPLAAVYRRATALPAIESLLAADRLRPIFLMEAIRTRVVSADELRAVDPELRTLRNLNTPEDYQAALEELASELTPLPHVAFELFGVPRMKAGVACLSMQAATLGQALEALARACPALEGTVTVAGFLQPSYTVNLNGERFVRDSRTPLVDGDSLLLMSVDVGG